MIFKEILSIRSINKLVNLSKLTKMVKRLETFDIISLGKTIYCAG